MFDRMLRNVFNIIETSLEDIERDMSKLIEEAENIGEDTGGIGSSKYYKAVVVEYKNGGIHRLEVVENSTSNTSSKIQELPLDEDDELQCDNKGGVVEVGGVPLRLEEKGRDWRMNNR